MSVLISATEPIPVSQGAPMAANILTGSITKIKSIH